MTSCWRLIVTETAKEEVLGAPGRQVRHVGHCANGFAETVYTTGWFDLYKSGPATAVALSASKVMPRLACPFAGAAVNRPDVADLPTASDTDVFGGRFARARASG